MTQKYFMCINENGDTMPIWAKNKIEATKNAKDNNFIPWKVLKIKTISKLPVCIKCEVLLGNHNAYKRSAGGVFMHICKECDMKKVFITRNKKDSNEKINQKISFYQEKIDWLNETLQEKFYDETKKKG